MTLPLSQPNYFDNSEVGAPTLNNVGGALLEVIRACAINGINPRAVTSIDVASGVATATAAAHGYTAAYGKLLLIEGAPEALLNGRKQPLSVATNTFTFDATGVADGTYTGTISAKRAPLGWTEDYNDGVGTKAIFSRASFEANDVQLRVNDTAAAPASVTYARVLAVRGATDVDTFTARAPLNAQVADGLTAFRGANTATAKHWVLVGTDRDLWLFVADPTAVKFQPSICFFDGEPYRPGDAYFTGIAATNGTAISNVQNSAFAVVQLQATPATPGYGVLFSDGSGVGSPEPFAIGSPFRSGGGHGDNAAGVPTDPLDFVVAFDLFVRGISLGARGTIPGLGEPFVGSDSVVFDRHQVHYADDGTPMLLVKINYGGTVSGMTAFKLTGWR